MWGGNEEGKSSFCLVNWNIVEVSKELGGFGVGNIIYKNLALFIKWVWRFLFEEDVLCRNLVV